MIKLAQILEVFRVLKKFLLLSVQNVKDHPALINFFSRDGRFHYVYRRGTRFQTPNCIQSHKRCCLGSHLINPFSPDLMNFSVLVIFELISSENVLGRRLLSIENIVICSSGCFCHKIVLSEHFFCIFDLASLGNFIFKLFLTLDAGELHVARFFDRSL